SESGFALGYGLLMAGVLFGPAALKRVVGWTGLRWFGAISYGVYMWHLLLLESFTGLVVEHLQGWPPLLLYSLYWGWLLVFVVPCAFLLFWLVEKPCMALGRRRVADGGYGRLWRGQVSDGVEVGARSGEAASPGPVVAQGERRSAR
ncbi:MAG: acyltransferase, partial [Ktedonobacteraceae bacterium]|nr:acyltransferase [Ktedonobacteraceae bacterium]